ncbi:response regulator transcription factor [Paenibacillus turpanensis]|uniref:response regulator transcription factor n=1 Tax=Paenibacillus turpanensis TaxID=2689078 RepID=UPI0014076253|nr:response regulator transcription factor [Paenibacillus turpanensis]
MSKIQILIVDDEWNLRNLLRLYLMKNGFEVTEAANGHEALHLLNQHGYDLIILDVMMPGMDGWEVCKRIRQTMQIPVIMLTARTDTKDKVQGLTIGADDYIVKPFEPDELIARVFALLRRAQSNEEMSASVKQIEYLDLEILPEARLVKVQGQAVDFTPKEFDLLHFFAEHPNRAYTREVCLEQVWGIDFLGDTRTVDTHVKNLREKLRSNGLPYSPIQTVWGVGYKFEPVEV